MLVLSLSGCLFSASVYEEQKAALDDTADPATPVTPVVDPCPDGAAEVEGRHYPHDPKGVPLSLSQSIGITARFLGLVVIGNLIALALVLFLGLGVLIFFLLNGYLLGREYFQFAALRHRPMDEVTALQQRHGGEIFLAGLAIAAVLTIPIVNFLTPLFAGALMVHIYKGIEAKSA